MTSFHSVRTRLINYRELEPNWDSYRALRIEDECIERAIRFCDVAEEKKLDPPGAAPLNDGGVNLYWNNEDITVDFRPGGQLEINFEINGKESLRVCEKVFSVVQITLNS